MRDPAHSPALTAVDRAFQLCDEASVRPIWLTFLFVVALTSGCDSNAADRRNLDAFLVPADDQLDLSTAGSDGPPTDSDGGARDLRGATGDQGTGDLAGRTGDLAGLAGDLAGSAGDLAGPQPDMAGPAADLAGPAGPQPDMAGTYPIYVSEASTLYSVDPTTWDITSIGSFGISSGVTDLALDSDGTLWAITSDMLYTVNVSTGKASAAVSSALAAFALPTNMEALSFFNDGSLFIGDKSGTITNIKNITFNSLTLLPSGSLGSSMHYAGDLATISSGTVWATIDNGSSASSTNNQLVIVNNSSFRGTALGAIGAGNVRGLVFVQDGGLVGFTSTGDILSIGRLSGASTVLKSHAGKSFTGATTSPDVSCPSC
jgi:hypothetical protein